MQEHALLRKRKRDDNESKRKWETKAKKKLENIRDKKILEKEKKGGGILMPEVFVSNYMKQQRNFVKYRR